MLITTRGHLSADETVGVRYDRLSSMDSAFLDIEKSGPSVAVGSAMMIEGRHLRWQKFAATRESGPRRHATVLPEGGSSRTKVRQAKWVDAEPDLEYHIDGVKLKPGESFDPVVGKDHGNVRWIAIGRWTQPWSPAIRRPSGPSCLHDADGQGALILLGTHRCDRQIFRLAAGIIAEGARRQDRTAMVPLG